MGRRAVLERNFDGEHPEVLRTRAGLGVSYMDAGELDAAAAVLEPVLETRRRTLEPHDSELAMTIGNVGLLAHHRGEFERARELLEEADGLHRAADRRSLDAADVAHNLAETHRLLQDRPRAIAVYERALALRIEVLGSEHEATEVTRTALRLLQDEAPK